MRKVLFIFFFLLMPVTVLAWTSINHFDTETTGDGWRMWQSGYGGVASITGSQYVPNDPSKSFQLMYPAGFPDSGVPGGYGLPFPLPTKEFWMQFYFKYSSNFQFHTVGNKLIYINRDYNGWSDSVINGNMWSDPHMWPGIKNVWLTSNTENNPTINRDQWYKVVFHIKIVSEGNDIFQLWVDDTLVSDYRNATVTNNYSGVGFTSVNIDPVWGGQAVPPVSKAATDYMWFDYAIVSTNPIDAVSGGNIKMIPSPPQSLLIK